MNNRIAELAEQARLHAKTVDADFNPQEWMDEYHKKFAELIVQDCVGIVRNQGPFLRYNAIAEAIQKHFGIKK